MHWRRALPEDVISRVPATLIETLTVKLLRRLQVAKHQFIIQLCHREPCDHNTVMKSKEGQHLQQWPFPKCLEQLTPLCGPTEIKF